MSQLREAAQQALDALYRWHMTDGETVELMPAFDALRAALAEPVPIIEFKITADKKEPVAWLFTNLQSGDYDFCYQEDEHDHDREMWQKQPLYTAPPQRKPLTEVDLRALYDLHAAYQEEGPEASGWWSFARAIERAHGITE